MSAIDLIPPAPIVLEASAAVTANFELQTAALQQINVVPQVTNAAINVTARTPITVSVAPLSGGNSDRDLLTVDRNGQTVFILSKPPNQPHLTQLFVNSNKATFGTDYTINGVLLNWRSTLVLETSDKLEIFY